MEIEGRGLVVSDMGIFLLGGYVITSGYTMTRVYSSKVLKISLERDAAPAEIE